MKRALLALGIGAGALLATGCQGGVGSLTPPPPTVSPAAATTVQASTDPSAYASYLNARTQARASIQAQVAPLSDAQRRALAIQWTLEPINGTPDQVEREIWAQTYLRAAASAANNYNAKSAECQRIAAAVGDTTATSQWDAYVRCMSQP